uniref:DNA-directed RNA polymerase n=1 Tax=Globodera rostochiensis TaxID=31243 RepID=A0A914HJX1_GLORO
MSESEVVFRQGELLCGVLDKAHYGATQFGLIHCCYELYGSNVAVQVLSCFSRVFTTFLQFHGFTLGVTDILVTRRADRERKRAISELLKCGEAVVRKTCGLPEDTSPETIRHTLATAYNHPRADRSMVKLYDFTMKQTLNKYSEQINNICVPSGLIREFPRNSLQLMIQSGAKGSLVNSIQISCALGQIELEGQRPPRSVTGRSLPSFRSFDPTPRAGGFVSQRFLTGINPQELFFHTMAGREGLIDTAVKTSRSGYLQRCVIKHLEGLTVRYDHTVRDFDNSVVQFRYGEDGMDVGRATFLDPKHFPFLSQNAETIRQNIIPSGITDEIEREKWHLAECGKQFKRISKFKRRKMRKMQMNENREQFLVNKSCRDSSFLEFCRHREANELKQSLVSEWTAMSAEKRADFTIKHSKAPTPVDVKFHPETSIGALPERMLEQLEDFINRKSWIGERPGFRQAINWKGLRALADPGECVGLLAAQSIGEPSTQMTLNTFHFAGRGEMNVTLGIPRLREILMTQSKNISTPLTEVCFCPDVSEDQIEQIKSELNPIFLRTTIRKFVLEEKVFVNENGNFLREYSLHIALLDNGQRDPATRHLEGRRILAELELRFGRQVASTLAKRYKEVREYQQIQHKKLRVDTLDTVSEEVSHRPRHEEEDLESDEEEAAGGVRSREADANEEKLSRRHLDDAADYEGEEQDRNDAGIDEMDRDEDNEEELQQDVGEEPTELDENDEEGAVGRRSTINADRIKSVLESHTIIGGYEYDVQNEQWCTFRIHMPLLNKTRIDVLAIVEREIDTFVLTQVPGIEKCNVREEQRNGRTTRVLQTQGINLGALYARANFLDISSVYSNDIDFMLRNFGIEAAARTISREMNNVFGVYGIEVNPRHLLLTADYMTFTGEVQPFSRGAMADSASPLQKMTFETTVTFMREALISGQFDSLFSPSARLVTGQMVRCGTGAFELLNEPKYVLRKAKRRTTNR